jgi:3',5'-cyclic-AMP phosphodiesterase
VLECGLWAGAGLLWAMSSGVPRSSLIGKPAAARTNASALNFIQISDSHIGFNKAPNPDATLTFKALLDRLSAVNPRPARMLHTGDVSHLSRDAEWDTAQQLVNETGIETYFIPGEHDMLVDGGNPFFARFARQAQPGGWYSFDQRGVHFVALINDARLKPAAREVSARPNSNGWRTTSRVVPPASLLLC